MRSGGNSKLRRAVGAALLSGGLFLALAAVPATVIDRALNVQQIGAGEYRVSWDPFLSQGLRLQTEPDLLNPMWQDVMIAPTTVGNRRQVDLMAPAPSFFRLECTADGNQDVPDDNFIDNDCDGIDGNIGASVFVSTTTGNDANPGTTPQHPLATITHALAVAVNTGRQFILVAAGDYAEPTLAVPQAFYIFGGYTASDWSRSDSNLTRILSTSSTALVTQQGAVTPAVLDHLTIVAANAAPSQSSYGVRVSPAQLVFGTSLPALNIHKCTVQAGHGGDGTDGPNGVNGANGGNGSDGSPGCIIGGAGCPFCTVPTPGAGGARGSGSANCATPYGGKGGTASYANNQSQFGENGANAGDCGNDLHGCGGEPGTYIFHPNAFDGVPGRDGTAGVNGAAGYAGGSYGYSGWSVVDGQSGTNGTTGTGGGGGGGGAGGDSSCNGQVFGAAAALAEEAVVAERPELAVDRAAVRSASTWRKPE